jgi:cell division inhibitor SepF
MSMWKKAMDYLGLGPDDAYDDYEAPQEQPRQARPPREEQVRPGRAPGGEYETETVRPVPTRQTFPSGSDITGRRPLPATDDSGVQPRPINPRSVSATRPINGAAAGEPYTVRPRRFDSAQEVADKFKEGLPVIMNLEAADREVSRRLIDFASGLCYALDGSMEKVASGVYLLKPAPRSSGFDNAGFGA